MATNSFPLNISSITAALFVKRSQKKLVKMFRALTDYVGIEIEFIDCEVFRKFLLSTLIVVTLWR